jgi:lipopolysaccharide transport system ATP-binding protein
MQIQINKSVIMEQTAEFLDVVEDAVIFSILRNPICQMWTKVYLPNTVDIQEIR